MNQIDMLQLFNHSLTEFYISRQLGFLSDDRPIRCLSCSYYEPWEAIGKSLPELIKTARLREQIDKLPVLSISKLTLETEWRRAYVLLSFMTQGYIWGGETPAETLPPAISCPFIAVSAHLGLPPIATCAALNLWNFGASPPSDAISNPDNLVALQTFTGTIDESWFYVVSVAMEARGGSMIPVMLCAVHSARTGDTQKVSEALRALTECLHELEALLGRMYEKCNPDVFYHRIRPMLAGSKNASTAGLPNGVFYDEGEGKGRWRHLSGASNAQSSLIPFFDIVLGVKHSADGKSTTIGQNGFMQEMRSYMPRQHASFLGQLCPNTIRDCVLSSCMSDPITGHYNSAIAALTSFRNKHLQIITRYIILPSRKASSSESVLQDSSLTIRSNHQTQHSSKNTVLLGTAGSQMVPFLKHTRDETRDAIIDNLLQ